MPFHLSVTVCRYADVLVHRLLAASLNLAPLPDSARDRAGVHALTDNLNLRHRNAQMAGRASVELHTLIFFKDRIIIADARITRVFYCRFIEIHVLYTIVHDCI